MAPYCYSTAYIITYENTNSTTDSIETDWYTDYTTGKASTYKERFAYKMLRDYGTTTNCENAWYDWNTNHKAATWYTNNYKWYTDLPTLSPQDQLRDIIRSRQAPLIITSRKPMPNTTDTREIRARETLLRVLGEDKFKRFLKHGFVSVRAKSGLVYQIFPSHGITNVYEDGEKVERLCVVLRGNFPPTDSLIMRYLLILNDERDFRNHAIKHTVFKKRPDKQAIIRKTEPLPKVWGRLRAVA